MLLSAFYDDHKTPAKHLKTDEGHSGYLQGKYREKAADALFPKSLLLTKKCGNEDTFAKAYIPFRDNTLTRINSVEHVATDRTLQDVRRFDVFFDVEDNGHFYPRYEYYVNPQGIRLVTQDESHHSDPMREESEYMLPSHLFADVLGKRQNMGEGQTGALIQQLRFALDTRYRTQEFESYSLVFERLQGFHPAQGMVMPFTDGARRHNLLLKGDRLTLHTEMEYMLNHFDGETQLGNLVTVRAERIMVFDLKNNRSTAEHLFIKRIA